MVRHGTKRTSLSRHGKQYTSHFCERVCPACGMTYRWDLDTQPPEACDWCGTRTGQPEPQHLHLDATYTFHNKRGQTIYSKGKHDKPVPRSVPEP